MFKKVVLIVVLAAMGLTLASCGQCGFFWDDWRSKSCRGEPAPK